MFIDPRDDHVKHTATRGEKIALALIIIAILTGLLLIGKAARADEINLSWTPPTQFTDGSQLSPSDIKEYEIQRAASAAGNFVRVVSSPGNTNKVHKLPDAPGGSQCYRLITVDKSDRRSSPSNIACINTSPPGAATGVTVSVTITVSAPNPSP